MVQAPAWFDRLAPKGSLGRYAVAGVFNTAIFAVMLVVLGWAGGVTREQSEAWAVVWGIAWMGSSIVAHWVHRGFSFIPSTKITYSLSTALPIYTLSFIGSSATFGLILEFTTWYLWFITAINTGAWGITQWLLNRTVIFRHDRAVRMARAQEE